MPVAAGCSTQPLLRRRRDGLLRRCHLLLLLLRGLGLGFDGLRLMHGLLETLDGLTETFSQLRQFACAENDQHDEENQNQLCKTHTPKHGVFLRK